MTVRTPTAFKSNMSNHPSPTRKVKLKLSCDACAKSKVACSKQQPECERCLHKGYNCTYSSSNRRGKKKREHTSPSPIKAVPENPVSYGGRQPLLNVISGQTDRRSPVLSPLNDPIPMYEPDATPNLDFQISSANPGRDLPPTYQPPQSIFVSTDTCMSSIETHSPYNIPAFDLEKFFDHIPQRCCPPYSSTLGWLRPQPPDIDPPFKSRIPLQDSLYDSISSHSSTSDSIKPPQSIGQEFQGSSGPTPDSIGCYAVPFETPESLPDTSNSSHASILPGSPSTRSRCQSTAARSADSVVRRLEIVLGSVVRCCEDIAKQLNNTDWKPENCKCTDGF